MAAFSASTMASFSATASLIHNNLTCSRNGWAASAHLGQQSATGKVMLCNLSSPTGGPLASDGPACSQVTMLRHVTCAQGSMLVVTSTNGTQIFTEDATHLVFFAPLDGSVACADSVGYHQGACFASTVSHVVVGSSQGSLLVVQNDPSGNFTALSWSPPATPVPAVADVCYVAAGDAVVSAHANGTLVFWAMTPTGPYGEVAHLPGSGDVPVRLASFGPRFALAMGSGVIRLYDAVSRALQVEVAAHARWLTALAVDEERMRMASVGEDTVLNVWGFGDDGRVLLLKSAAVTDKLLTGVDFQGASVLVSAYDDERMFFIGE